MGKFGPDEVLVERTERDGWYVYTSEQVPGLYVASLDDRIAYEDVPTSISILMEHDLEKKLRVRHQQTYSEFRSKYAGRGAPRFVTLLVQELAYAT